MTDTLNKAIDAVAKHRHHALPDLRHGDRVVELGGDGATLIIASFQSVARGEWEARCLKLGTSDIVVLPVNSVKPINQHTIH